VGEILPFKSLFLIVDARLNCEDIVVRWYAHGDCCVIFASYIFSEPRAAHFRHAFCTERDAVWVEDSGWPKESCVRWGPDPPWKGVIFTGKGVPL